MKRKAIQLAHQTTVISLPIKWVKQRGIKKGDEIDVSSYGNKLLISTDFNLEPKKIRIDTKNTEFNTFKKTFAAMVKAGYNEIEIDFSSLEEARAIQKFLRNSFSNLNITKQINNTFIVSALYESEPKEIENAIRRFFLLVINLVEETAESISKKDLEGFFKASLIRFDLYTLSNYIKRTINLGYETKYKRIAPLYVIVESWMNMANIYLKIGRYMIDNKLKLKKEIADFSYKLVELHEKYYNLKEIQKRDAEYNKIEKQLASLASITSTKEIKIISYYDMILNQFKELTRTLITLNI